MKNWIHYIIIIHYIIVICVHRFLFTLSICPERVSVSVQHWYDCNGDTEYTVAAFSSVKYQNIVKNVPNNISEPRMLSSHNPQVFRLLQEMSHMKESHKKNYILTNNKL